MKRIKEIKIKNFKAFQGEEIFTINGKNVLVYGNNGAGKSSLFWALYTILQSSGKTDPQIQKYFKEFDEGNTGTHQSLKNVFLATADESYVKITSIDLAAVETTYTISHDTIDTNLDADTAIQELNLASDFINYKLLHNFYRGSHKQEVNLWPVFERDIFSLLTEDSKNWLEDIIKKDTKDVPRTPSGKPVSGKKREDFIKTIEFTREYFSKKRYYKYYISPHDIEFEISFAELINIQANYSKHSFYHLNKMKNKIKQHFKRNSIPDFENEDYNQHLAYFKEAVLDDRLNFNTTHIIETLGKLFIAFWELINSKYAKLINDLRFEYRLEHGLQEMLKMDLPRNFNEIQIFFWELKNCLNFKKERLSKFIPVTSRFLIEKETTPENMILKNR